MLTLYRAGKSFRSLTAGPLYVREQLALDTSAISGGDSLSIPNNPNAVGDYRLEAALTAGRCEWKAEDSFAVTP